MKIAFVPINLTIVAVDIHENEGTITSSSFLIFKLSKDISKASVPEETPKQY